MCVKGSSRTRRSERASVGRTRPFRVAGVSPRAVTLVLEERRLVIKHVRPCLGLERARSRPGARVARESRFSRPGAAARATASGVSTREPSFERYRFALCNAPTLGTERKCRRVFSPAASELTLAPRPRRTAEPDGREPRGATGEYTRIK